MNNVSVSGANNIAFSSYVGHKTKTMLEKKKIEQINGGDQKLMDSLKWAGIIAAGALAATCTVNAIKKGKTLSLQTVRDEAGKMVHKVGGKTLTFDKGVAMLDGKKAKGLLRFATPNGCTLTYNNGILSESVKKGKDGFKKVYDSAGVLIKNASKNVIKKPLKKGN